MILIAGDSWGCGEWADADGRFELNHYGLNQYLFEAGNQVINFSKPGGSNFESAKILNTFLTISPQYQNTIKAIIVFQTEWIRDYNFKTPEQLTQDIGYGYVTLRDRWISRFYGDLCRISKVNNIPVYLIGGCSDTIWLSRFNEEYPGVTVLCQSLTNLLVNNDHRIDNPVYSLYDEINLDKLTRIKNHCSNNDLEQLITAMGQSQERLQVWGNHPEFFYPDGRHANRAGHKVIFDLLVAQGVI